MKQIFKNVYIPEGSYSGTTRAGSYVQEYTDGRYKNWKLTYDSYMKEYESKYDIYTARQKALSDLAEEAKKEVDAAQKAYDAAAMYGFKTINEAERFNAKEKNDSRRTAAVEAGKDRRTQTLASAQKATDVGTVASLYQSSNWGDAAEALKSIKDVIKPEIIAGVARSGKGTVDDTRAAVIAEGIAQAHERLKPDEFDKFIDAVKADTGEGGLLSDKYKDATTRGVKLYKDPSGKQSSTSGSKSGGEAWNTVEMDKGLTPEEQAFKKEKEDDLALKKKAYLDALGELTKNVPPELGDPIDEARKSYIRHYEGNSPDAKEYLEKEKAAAEESYALDYKIKTLTDLADRFKKERTRLKSENPSLGDDFDSDAKGLSDAIEYFKNPGILPTEIGKARADLLKQGLEKKADATATATNQNNSGTTPPAAAAAAATDNKKEITLPTGPLSVRFHEGLHPSEVPNFVKAPHPAPSSISPHIEGYPVRSPFSKPPSDIKPEMASPRKPGSFGVDTVDKVYSDDGKGISKPVLRSEKDPHEALWKVMKDGSDLSENDSKFERLKSDRPWSKWADEMVIANAKSKEPTNVIPLLSKVDSVYKDLPDDQRWEIKAYLAASYIKAASK